MVVSAPAVRGRQTQTSSNRQGNVNSQQIATQIDTEDQGFAPIVGVNLTRQRRADQGVKGFGNHFAVKGIDLQINRIGRDKEINVRWNQSPICQLTFSMVSAVR